MSSRLFWTSFRFWLTYAGPGRNRQTWYHAARRYVMPSSNAFIRSELDLSIYKCILRDNQNKNPFAEFVYCIKKYAQSLIYSIKYINGPGCWWCCCSEFRREKAIELIKYHSVLTEGIINFYYPYSRLAFYSVSCFCVLKLNPKSDMNATQFFPRTCESKSAKKKYEISLWFRSTSCFRISYEDEKIYISVNVVEPEFNSQHI